MRPRSGCPPECDIQGCDRPTDGRAHYFGERP